MYHQTSQHQSPTLSTTAAYSPQGGHLSPGADLSQQQRRLSQNSAERRANHNATERLRREHLNTRFTELAMALPALRDNKKPSKSQIVCKSLEYIQLLTTKLMKRDQVLQELFEENVALRDALNQQRQQMGEEPLPQSQSQLKLQQMMQEEEAEEQLEMQRQQQLQQHTLPSGSRSSTPAILTVPQPTPPLTPLPASRKSSETHRIAIPVCSPRGNNTVSFSPASSTASFHPQSFQAPQLRVQIPIQQQQQQLQIQQQQQNFGWMPGSGIIPLTEAQQFALAQSCPSQFSTGLQDFNSQNRGSAVDQSAMYKQSGFTVPAPLDMDVQTQINQVLNGGADLLDQAFLMDEDYEGSHEFENLHVTPVTPVDVTEQAIMDDLVFLE